MNKPRQPAVLWRKRVRIVLGVCFLAIDAAVKSASCHTRLSAIARRLSLLYQVAKQPGARLGPFSYQPVMLHGVATPQVGQGHPAAPHSLESADTTYHEPERRGHQAIFPGTYRILMVAPTSFFGDYGCHVRILEETRILTALGQQVAIFTYHKGRDIPGVDIRRAPATPWRSSYEVGSSRHKIALDILLSAKLLLAGLPFRPNIIHAHTHEGALIGGVLAKSLRVPLIFDFQGSMTSEMLDHHFLHRQSTWLPLWQRLEAFINRLPQAVLTSSLHGSDLCIRQFGIPAKKVYTVQDCVNADVFQPSVIDAAARLEKRARLGIPPGRKVIVYLGLLVEYQGIGRLLEAARHLTTAGEDLHFLIMGYPSQEVWAARAQELGLADRTTFTGKIPYEEAPQYLALGDIAAAPKLSATEGAGKILNYMAMGLPVVAFDTPVSREYLRAEGIYAAPGNTHELAQAIAHLHHNPDLAADISQRLRKRAIQSYSWRQAATHIMNAYDAISPRAK
ncbi:MAG: glycosyltransferase family 1 protein [Chloroflexi bacterium]|nr:glycosyltransferase family 1 protein [Chloroflexota bacterium]